MDNQHHLLSKGLKPTSNRLLVLKAITEAPGPVSLSEIDEIISTMYKATIFRVLGQFVEHDVVHTIDDGTGAVKYEICHSEQACGMEDMHVHFFCEKCHRTICLEDTALPKISLPAGYEAHSANYVVKGICDKCSKRI